MEGGGVDCYGGRRVRRGGLPGQSCCEGAGEGGDRGRGRVRWEIDREDQSRELHRVRRRVRVDLRMVGIDRMRDSQGVGVVDRWGLREGEERRLDACRWRSLLRRCSSRSGPWGLCVQSTLGEEELRSCLMAEVWGVVMPLLKMLKVSSRQVKSAL